MRTLIIYLSTAFALLLFTAPVKAQDLNSSVTLMIKNYINLKNTLVTGDGNAAESKAKALLMSINAVPVSSMNTKQISVWNKYAAKLQFDSRHISEVNRVEHQREHFSSLSDNLYQVLKGLKLNQTVLYREYCRMNKQYYLSETSSGKDPYMGMALCSKVVETLPAVN